MAIKIGKNIIVSEFTAKQNKQTFKICLMSDLHWDNPKCDREKLKADLDYCLKNSIPIAINGDFFCLMQGKYDPRRNKMDIRPEHNKVNYIDAVIEDAVDWFKPYAHLIEFIGYGNHETGIIKNLETDPLQRFVDLLNYEMKTYIQTGAYGGWYRLRFNRENSNGIALYNIKYFHGSGGGGIVTRGEINLTRMSEMIDGADMHWIGHVHESKETIRIKEYLTAKGEVKQRQVLSVITPPYKEEYGDGSFGWHVQRGAPPKPIGCRILEIDYHKQTMENVLFARTYQLS
jgi:hypothetical protein